MIPSITLAHFYNPTTGELTGSKRVERRLSDLKGSFADQRAYEELLARGDPLLYATSVMEPASGEGDLHYGLGVLYPGKVGAEYFLTKGHLHAWRPAAEIYIGLSGHGAMLLEDEKTGESRLERLEKNSVIYVPGHTAHRTMNIGFEPLVYIGVYSAKAGHDYDVISQRNFLKVLVEQNGQPVLFPRVEWLSQLKTENSS